MNILLVVIDTLRYDYISAHGRNRFIQTPNLDELARKSWAFDRAYSASYPTIPHRTDVMTGRYGDPFHAWMPLRFDATTLPELLADAGYCTQLIHDTPHLVNGGHAFDYPFQGWTFLRGAEVDRPWVDDKGFTYLPNWARDPLFDFMGDPEMEEVRDHVLVTYTRANRNRQQPEDWNAAQLFLTASDFLKENAKRENFFLWVDCFDPHEPWDAPPEFVRMYDRTPGYDGRIDPRCFLGRAHRPEDKSVLDAIGKRLSALYSAKVSWVDHWFGRLLRTLEETGLDENTAVLLTADHGTNVGERGRFGKSLPVNEQEAHIPLLVHVPGRSAGRVGHIVQPQDLFATILGIAGAERPVPLQGYDLLQLAEGEGAETRTVALSGTHPHSWGEDPDRAAFTVFGGKWYLNLAPRSGACRLYAYGSTEDVASAHPDVVKDLRQRGLKELARRGASAELVEWLRGEGKESFPEEDRTRPGPANWTQYWNRAYNRW